MTEPQEPGQLNLNGQTGGELAEAIPAAETTAGQLVIYVEGNVQRTFTLNVPVITIGRTPGNVLPLLDPSVSRAHAELRVATEGLILTDLGSANGTFVGDTRLAPQQPVIVPPGSFIRIGPFVLRYDAAASPQVRPASASADGGQPPTSETMVPEAVAMAVAGFSPAPAPRPTTPAPPPFDPLSTYLDFLPVIFQDADFLGRFLLIFQSIWEPLEYRQDHVAMYFDPRTCPSPFLGWLAEWLGLSIGPHMEEGRLRALLAEAVELHRWRGTRYGLTRMIEICTGVTPMVAESSPNPAVLHIRVALPAAASIDREAIERIIRANKPAHTAYLLEVLEAA